MWSFKRLEKTADGGSVRISYTTLSIGLITLFIIVAVVFALDRIFGWQIALREYISMSAFGCVSIGLIYNATSVQFNYQLNKQKFEKESQQTHNSKIKFTYEVVSEWYKGDMALNAEMARRFLQPYKGKLNKFSELSDFKKELSKQENVIVRKSLISVLNYFEHLSLLCVDNVIDENTLRKVFRTVFITYYTNLKHYIEDEQRGNSGGNSKIYINFVEVANKWLYN